MSKMAPSDSSKIVLGVLALAGLGLAFFLLRRRFARNKNSKDVPRSKNPGERASIRSMSTRQKHSLTQRGQGDHLTTVNEPLPENGDEGRKINNVFTVPCTMAEGDTWAKRGKSDREQKSDLQEMQGMHFAVASEAHPSDHETKQVQPYSTSTGSSHAASEINSSPLEGHTKESITPVDTVGDVAQNIEELVLSQEDTENTSLLGKENLEKELKLIEEKTPIAEIVMGITDTSRQDEFQKTSKEHVVQENDYSTVKQMNLDPTMESSEVKFESEKDPIDTMLKEEVRSITESEKDFALNIESLRDEDHQQITVEKVDKHSDLDSQEEEKNFSFLNNATESAAGDNEHLQPDLGKETVATNSWPPAENSERNLPSFEVINSIDSKISMDPIGDVQAVKTAGTKPLFQMQTSCSLQQSMPDAESGGSKFSSFELIAAGGDASTSMPAEQQAESSIEVIASPGSSLVDRDELTPVVSELIDQKEDKQSSFVEEETSIEMIASQGSSVIEKDELKPAVPELLDQREDKQYSFIEEEPSSEVIETSDSTTGFKERQGVEAYEGFQPLSGAESIESFQSLGYLETSSTTSGSRQDFFSPISSPENLSQADASSAPGGMLSAADMYSSSSSFETAQSEGFSFEDEEDEVTIDPHDRTPTNTPVPAEILTDGDATTPSSVEALTSFAKEIENESQDAQNGNLEKGIEPVNDSDEGILRPQWQTKTHHTNGDAEWKQKMHVTDSTGLGIDRDKMAQAILQAQTTPEQIEMTHLLILVEMLKQDDLTLVNTAVQSIIRVSAFIYNVNILRVCDCPKELVRLLEKFVPAIVSGDFHSGSFEGPTKLEDLVLSITHAINNLAMDIKSQPLLESSIPLLTELLLTEGLSENIAMASLQPLTNLSTSSTYHGHYTRVLQQLYSMLDMSHNKALRLQCLKVLVNLSLNGDMVPHMLAAKAPDCLLDLLDTNCDMDLLLRMVTFLANVMAIMQERELTPSNLPPDDKAPSPETLHASLFSHERRDTLRNKVFRLTRHESEDVCYQASRLYKIITSVK